MYLKDKKILLAVCGSIAAYKSALLVRLLVKAGAEVQVLLTDSAAEFITPLTLATLSKRPVFSRFVDGEQGLWNNHVDLGLWADLMVVAPATGNTLAKMRTGQSDNLVVATYLSARCPVFFAPAMDLDMWHHPATQENVTELTKRGNQLIPVGSGELASGLSGEGRMAEPEEITAYLDQFFRTQITEQALNGKRILISAGPTREELDPVRFLGNNSSGKMGIALAEEAHLRGAEVTLVLGPTTHLPKINGIEIVAVKSAADMFQAIDERFEKADWCIMAAAVADYRPKERAAQKIKKKAGTFSLEMERTTDILGTMGKMKQAHQLLIGFALESENGRANAQSKLERKNLDLIVLNTLADKGAGFQHDTNKITILDSDNKEQDFELKSKAEVAIDVLDYATQFRLSLSSDSTKGVTAPEV